MRDARQPAPDRVGTQTARRLGVFARAWFALFVTAVCAVSSRADACSCVDPSPAIVLPPTAGTQLPGHPWLIMNWRGVEPNLVHEGTQVPLEVFELDENVTLCGRTWTVVRPLDDARESSTDGFLELTDHLDGARTVHAVRVAPSPIQTTLVTIELNVRRDVIEPRPLGSCHSALVVDHTAIAQYSVEVGADRELPLFVTVEAHDAVLGTLRAVGTNLGPDTSIESDGAVTLPVLATTADCVTIKIFDWVGNLLEMRDECPTATLATHKLENRLAATHLPKPADAKSTSCMASSPGPSNGAGTLFIAAVVFALSRIRVPKFQGR